MSQPDNEESVAIEFRHVSLSFDDQPALTDISFKALRNSSSRKLLCIRDSRR